MSRNKYGLILRDASKSQTSFKASRNVFGSDSESEDDSGKKPVLLKPSDNINRRTKIVQEKAVLEDPTVYQYDEIYDSMAKDKESKKVKNKEEKKPKYIEKLMKSATKRKLENERRIERQIQKERVKEGDEFADKEVFVTSAYKKKLEEMRIEEEKEKYEEYLESIGDVTRQKDLGGFYRHLYEQKLGSDKATRTPEKVSQDVHKEINIEKEPSKTIEKCQQAKQRNYRKRKYSHDNRLSEGEIEDSDEEINRCNLDDIRISKKLKQTQENIDADSDFSIDESSDEDVDRKKADDITTEKESEKSVDADNKKKSFSPPPSPVKENKSEIPKVKIDIWKKRTVGEAFEQALKRYYERKASRGA